MSTYINRIIQSYSLWIKIAINQYKYSNIARITGIKALRNNGVHQKV